MLLWILGCMCHSESVFSFFSSYIPRGRIAGSSVVIFLGFCFLFLFFFFFFWGTSILHQFTFLTAVYCSCLFSMSLPALLFVFFLMIVMLTGWCDISLNVWFAFLWWLVILSIFSHADWSSVCLLQKTVCSSLLPIFKFFYFELHELFMYFGY